jgi:hypothetical protein
MCWNLSFFPLHAFLHLCKTWRDMHPVLGTGIWEAWGTKQSYLVLFCMVHCTCTYTHTRAKGNRACTFFQTFMRFMHVLCVFMHVLCVLMHVFCVFMHTYICAIPPAKDQPALQQYCIHTNTHSTTYIHACMHTYTRYGTRTHAHIHPHRHIHKCIHTPGNCMEFIVTQKDSSCMQQPQYHTHVYTHKDT